MLYVYLNTILRIVVFRNSSFLGLVSPRRKLSKDELQQQQQHEKNIMKSSLKNDRRKKISFSEADGLSPSSKGRFQSTKVVEGSEGRNSPMVFSNGRDSPTRKVKEGENKISVFGVELSNTADVGLKKCPSSKVRIYTSISLRPYIMYVYMLASI